MEEPKIKKEEVREFFEEMKKEEETNGMERVQLVIPKAMLYKIMEFNRKKGIYIKNNKSENIRAFINFCFGVLEAIDKER